MLTAIWLSSLSQLRLTACFHCRCHAARKELPRFAYRHSAAARFKSPGAQDACLLQDDSFCPLRPNTRSHVHKSATTSSQARALSAACWQGVASFFCQLLFFQLLPFQVICTYTIAFLLSGAFLFYSQKVCQGSQVKS